MSSIKVLSNWDYNGEELSFSQEEKIQKYYINTYDTLIIKPNVNDEVQETKITTLYNHKINMKGLNITRCQQLDGYQFIIKDIKKRTSETFILPIGRRLTQKKIFVKTIEELDKLFGLSSNINTSIEMDVHNNECE